MLKKTRISHHPFTSTTSLFCVPEDRHASVKESEIKKLFSSEQRQVFQLDYLYNSPHFSHYPSYRELISLLERYNEQSIYFNNMNSPVDNNTNASSIVKQAVLKFIYMQMLAIAVMKDWEVKANDFATKLKDWYYGLMDKRSFLEGLNLKKKEQGKQLKEETNIRASYLSNVYDEIEDYMRKKMDYSMNLKRFNIDFLLKPKIKKESTVTCNLPMIDNVLYQREDARLREIREKQFDKCYLIQMANNRNLIRQNSLTKFRLKNYHRDTATKTEYKESGLQKINAGLTMSTGFYSKQRQNIHKQNKPPKSKQKPLGNLKMISTNLLSLSNINGINLIHNKNQ